MCSNRASCGKEKHMHMWTIIAHAVPHTKICACTSLFFSVVKVALKKMIFYFAELIGPN